MRSIAAETPPTKAKVVRTCISFLNMPYWKALTIRWRLPLLCSLLVTGDKGRQALPLTHDGNNGTDRRTIVERKLYFDRYCTRPSPLYRTASDEKLGVGLGTWLTWTLLQYITAVSSTVDVVGVVYVRACMCVVYIRARMCVVYVMCMLCVYRQNYQLLWLSL